MRAFIHLNAFILSCTLFSCLARALPLSDEISSPPSRFVKLNLKRETVSADIPIDYSPNQGRWFANVTVGGQDLELLVDTGSGDL